MNPPRLTPVDRPSLPEGIPQQAACFSIEIMPEELSEVVDHVRNTEYLRWLDRAAELHLEHLGWSYDHLVSVHRLFFVARHEIDYLGEVRADDNLLLATWVRDVRRVKSWRDSIIYRREEDGQYSRVCQGATLWVHVDLKTRRPVSIPTDMITSLQPAMQRQPRSRRTCT